MIDETYDWTQHSEQIYRILVASYPEMPAYRAAETAFSVVDYLDNALNPLSMERQIRWLTEDLRRERANVRVLRRQVEVYEDPKSYRDREEPSDLHQMFHGGAS